MSRATTRHEHGSKLALEFANTLVSDRPGRDLLSSPHQLLDWTERHRSVVGSLEPDPERLDDYRSLRTAVRGLLSAAAAGQPLPDEDVAVVNAAAHAAAAWPELRVGDDGMPAVIDCYAVHDNDVRAMARIVESVFILVGGPDLDRIGACEGPRCRRFFLAAHPARRWCDSTVCGNRVRVARFARRRLNEKAAAESSWKPIA